MHFLMYAQLVAQLKLEQQYKFSKLACKRQLLPTLL